MWFLNPSKGLFEGQPSEKDQPQRIYMPVGRLSVYTSISLSVCPSVYLSVCLSVYLSPSACLTNINFLH